MKDYDFTIKYHFSKVNVVADALNMKSFSKVVVLITFQKSLLDYIRRMELQVILPSDSVSLASLVMQSTLLDRIKVA